MQNSLNSKLLGSCMIIAPLAFGASTFFWKDGEYGVTGGTILALAMVFWIPAFIGLFELLKNEMPNYTSIALLVSVYGCISGANFGMVGVLSDTFQISHEAYLSEAAKQPLAFNLLLFWSGPLFPLSLLVFGIITLIKKVVPSWTAVLICLGAIAFPLSRIPRIEVVAHIADILLIIPLAYLGFHFYIKPQHLIQAEIEKRND